MSVPHLIWIFIRFQSLVTSGITSTDLFESLKYTQHTQKIVLYGHPFKLTQEEISQHFNIFQHIQHAVLTHLNLKKMAAILQTTFSNTFSVIKTYEFWFKFHWSSFIRVQLVISSTCSKMAWCRPLSETMMAWFTDENMRNSVLMLYSDVIMSRISSQITSLTIVYSNVYSGADQRKHQSSASLAFKRGIRRWPVNSPHKWAVKFPFDEAHQKASF